MPLFGIRQNNFLKKTTFLLFVLQSALRTLLWKRRSFDYLFFDVNIIRRGVTGAVDRSNVIDNEPSACWTLLNAATVKHDVL